MKTHKFKISEIYVPAKRRKELDESRMEAIAESIMDVGLQRPISVRQGNNRFVLIEGLHRLEAMKALGEETIDGIMVAARQH